MKVVVFNDDIFLSVYVAWTLLTKELEVNMSSGCLHGSWTEKPLYRSHTFVFLGWLGNGERFRSMDYL